MKLVFGKFTIESEKVEDLLSPSIIALLKETSNKKEHLEDDKKVEEKRKKAKRISKKTGKKVIKMIKWTPLELNIVRMNHRMPIRKIWKMIGKTHTIRAVNTKRWMLMK